jgi:hypothetical protein
MDEQKGELGVAIFDCMMKGSIIVTVPGIDVSSYFQKALRFFNISRKCSNM